MGRRDPVIVLDTHAWVWWLDAPKRLSDTARSALDEHDSAGVCSISALEVCTLVRRGRLALDRDAMLWIRQALAQERVVELPLRAATAARAGLLDDAFPGDPADRAIYATALDHGAQLVTADRAMRAFDPERTVW